MTTIPTSSGGIPISTVPYAIQNLMAQVQVQVSQDPYSSEVLVYYGEPGMDTPNDMVEVGTTVHRTVAPEAFAGSYQVSGTLKETYTIDCLVSSWSGDPDPMSRLSRAYTLLAYVEAAVRTDPTLGDTVLDAHPSGTSGGQVTWTGGDSEDEGPIGRLCELTVTIAVTTLY